MAGWRWGGLILVISAMCGACVTSFRGTVYIDANRNGIRDRWEPPAPGVVVALDRGGFVRTDAVGRYRIDAPVAGGIVWARSPDGFRPGPVWSPALDDGDVDLGLRPLSTDEAASPLAFVVAADSHTTANPSDPWDGGDLEDAIDQATSLPDPPRFFTIVGDITQGATAGELDRVRAALDGSPVPWVPVPGNHDWLDGGAAYRARMGPDDYSFDIGRIHFVVWDTNLPDADQIAFFAADLAQVEPQAIVVALGHAPPSDEVVDQLAQLGVDYLFTGHWHANRRVDHGALVEWGTETFVMGGIDQSASGYRVVTFDGDTPTVVNRERMVEPQLALVGPHAGSCAAGGSVELLVAAALDAATPQVTARVDCGAAISLAPAGGWVFRGTTALAPGTHTIDLEAVSPSGRRIANRTTIDVCAPPAVLATAATWPQVGGGAEHAGATTATIAPPLQVAWTASVGAQVSLGSPVVANGQVLIALTDRDAGDTGGIVALDLATGSERWRVTTPSPVTAAPAVDGDSVVVTLAGGEVDAYALADGTPRWSFDVRAGMSSLATSIWAPPAVDGGRVFAGNQGRFVAIDLATGAAQWSTDGSPALPWLGSLGAPAVSGGLVLAAVDRDDGVVARDVATGVQRWALRGRLGTAVNAAPVVGAGLVYVCSAYGDVTAVDLATGAVRWTRALFPDGFDWAYAITAAPAYADGLLFVPTQWGALVALDAATGSERWRATTPPGPLELAHYRSEQPGFAASPIVTGDTVWIGRPDGRLVALAAATGEERWSTQLGAPVLSAPAPAGDALVVASYDGTVRALVPAAARPPAVPMQCPASPPHSGGGGCSAGGADGSLLVMLVLLVTVRRDARPRTRARCAR